MTTSSLETVRESLLRVLVWRAARLCVGNLDLLVLGEHPRAPRQRQMFNRRDAGEITSHGACPHDPPHVAGLEDCQ